MKIHSIAGFAGAMLVMGFLGGCASYMTPGGGVSIPEITTPNVADAMSRQPAAVFPARLAVVRDAKPITAQPTRFIRLRIEPL